jgi:hypothetical protein
MMTKFNCSQPPRHLEDDLDIQGEIDRLTDRQDYLKALVIAKTCTKEEAVEYAVNCARSVLHIFEEKYPEDKRPRQAIEAAEAWLRHPSEKNRRAAAEAAGAAAAAYAVYAAAYAAAAAADAYAAAAAAAAATAVDAADAAVADAVAVVAAYVSAATTAWAAEAAALAKKAEQQTAISGRRRGCWCC